MQESIIGLGMEMHLIQKIHQVIVIYVMKLRKIFTNRCKCCGINNDWSLIMKMTDRDKTLNQVSEQTVYNVHKISDIIDSTGGDSSKIITSDVINFFDICYKNNINISFNCEVNTFLDYKVYVKNGELNAYQQYK